MGEAFACYREALAIRPDYAEAHFNLGNVLRELGDIDGTLTCYRKALSIRPDYADAYTNMLFLHAYHGSLDPQDYLALARGWEQACVPEPERQAARERVFQRSPLTGRRLRLGYVSGDFRTHALSYFLEQLFAHHDRARVELFAYSTSAERDAVTARLQALVEHWASVAGVPEPDLRDRIEADGIDVLIDLSGHTGHNRLDVFARRVAPVQVHYHGYMASTGLSEMDYWIGDETLTPPETDAHYSETIWRLPRVWVAYEGKADAPVPARRAAADDAIWVGGFNHLAKLTPATLALWAGVLGALPQARLLLKTKALAEATNRRRILDAMAGHGIVSDRIELRDISLTPDWPSHMACYDSLDIALDPVGGLAGGTTSCDALWMGVPVVTLMGDRMASRMTASMLRALGHEEWIARSERDYIQKVVDLARDAQRRSALRFELRGQMAQSPLCDARGLARSLEAAYFEMVERWLRRRTH
jgi:predicted O-linked N-acetylglucosamine transferase (SPINDLY family)